VRLNEPLSPDVFRFVPPEHAQQVAKFDEASSPAEGLLGRPAPALRLHGLDGKTFRLSEQRGKVVLLEFWASWCAPCRTGLPKIDVLQQQWRKRDLVVAAVNTESWEAARRFLAESPLKMLVLVDGAREAVAALQVAAIPTSVIIDRQGRVTAHLVGPSEQQLFQALEQAGLQ
jgi:thiol-disulfide isomerase/thioredoxin